MNLTMLKSKIHRVKVTEANLEYVGSITIDKALLEASGILEYEKVQIADITNGRRFETYAIAGPEHSGMICLNGAAAREVQVNDRIIIMAYAQLDNEEAKQFKPTVVMVNEHNEATKIVHYEKYGRLSE